MTDVSAKRWLIAGAGGMLGADLVAALEGRAVTALGRADLDVTDPAAVLAAVSGHDIVINAAAYTRVDDAEAHEADAYAVNAAGAANLAAAAKAAGAVLVQVSTDYVFDGSATSPYPEAQPTAPVSAYGRTKAEGERLALDVYLEGTIIVRTAWLYGRGGGNFVKTMARLAGEHPTVSVVTDQVGQPTWSHDLAERIVELVDTGTRSGVFHGTNSGQASWFEFAAAVFDDLGLGADRVLPTTADAFVRPAPRPAYSVLGHDAWASVGLGPMRDWRTALDEALASGITA
ncbi:dTDP-4-dehydrorhamnose reductase [soil metagenome]